MKNNHWKGDALRQGDWKLVSGKRMPHEPSWELYNLAEDRCGPCAPLPHTSLAEGEALR